MAKTAKTTMMRFKVLGGKHHHSDGKTYMPGEVVSSEKDLTKTFLNKFVREQDLVFPAAGTDTAPSKDAATKAAEGDEDEEKTVEDEGDEGDAVALAARGKDVSEKFPVAVKNSYKVFVRNKHYSVYEPDEVLPLKGCEGLEKNAVEPAIEKLLET